MVFNARIKPFNATMLRVANLSQCLQFKPNSVKHPVRAHQYVSESKRDKLDETFRLRVSGPRRAPLLPTPKSLSRWTVTAYTSADPPATTTISDTFLGELFLKIFQGHLYYAFCYVMPIVTLIAALGAIYTKPLLLAIPTALHLLPPPLLHIIAAPTISSFLTFLATTQPWTGLISVTVSLLSAYYAFFLMPVMDLLLGTDYRNPDSADLRAAKKSVVYKSILRFYPFAHLSVLALVLHLACTYRAAISPPAFIGIAVSCGVAGGILFAAAHELIHSVQKIDRWLGNALLGSVFYMHWSDSHLAHHVKVATREDPSSARLGESLWHFIPRSVVGNMVDGWNWAEAGRLRRSRNNKNNKRNDTDIPATVVVVPKFPFWSLKNKILWWFACPALLNMVVAAIYGSAGVWFMAIQGIVAILLLETVNYIEHYGLERQRMIPRTQISTTNTNDSSTSHSLVPPSSSKAERYERVAPHHSWNASTIWTNSVTFSLQRHSDHHAADKRPYYLLNHIEDAPQLPAGYPSMMLLATIPPLFRRVMDPRVEKWKEQYYSSANNVQQLS